MHVDGRIENIEGWLDEYLTKIVSRIEELERRIEAIERNRNT